jgi:hypothetical protein
MSHEYVLTPGPLEDHQTALFVQLEVPVTQAGVEIEGTVPIAVSVERYWDVVALGAELHEAVVRTCRALRRESLTGWPEVPSPGVPID